MKSLTQSRNMVSRAMQCFAAAALLLTVATSHAAKDEIYTSLFSNVGASGYDVVSYFTEGMPVKGSKKFSADHMGAKWYFSSEAHLAQFTEDPDKYAPQYGGYCAWAVSNGDTASSDPLQWSIVNDKLYLNYDADIQARWQADRDNHIARADQNWPSVLD